MAPSRRFYAPTGHEGTYDDRSDFPSAEIVSRRRERHEEAVAEFTAPPSTLSPSTRGAPRDSPRCCECLVLVRVHPASQSTRDAATYSARLKSNSCCHEAWPQQVRYCRDVYPVSGREITRLRPEAVGSIRPFSHSRCIQSLVHATSPRKVKSFFSPQPAGILNRWML
jgi:hypothetical protein